MTEYNPVEMWRKSLSPADLDVHRGALFDSLRAAGKVSEKEVAGLSGGPDSLSKGDWLPGRREDYYEYGFNANLNTIDYIGPRF